MHLSKYTVQTVPVKNSMFKLTFLNNTKRILCILCIWISSWCALALAPSSNTKDMDVRAMWHHLSLSIGRFFIPSLCIKTQKHISNFHPIVSFLSHSSAVHCQTRTSPVTLLQNSQLLRSHRMQNWIHTFHRHRRWCNCMPAETSNRQRMSRTKRATSKSVCQMSNNKK